LFRLVVAREGYRSRFLDDVNPAGVSVEAALESLEVSEISEDRIFKGRILDHKGHPVFGARVSVEGWSTSAAPSRTTWGPPERVMINPMAVSNPDGEFTFFAKESLRSMNIEVTCPNYAQAEFYELKFGGEVKDFRLSEGGAVSGKLVNDGKPLSGRTILISSEDRTVRSNFTEASVATDSDGRFVFYNMPTGLVYYVTAEADSIKDLGITPLTRVEPLKEGESRDAGALEVEPGLNLSGRIKLSDDGALPKDSMIFLSHDKIWGSRRLSPNPDGTFAFEGLHPGAYRCSIRMPGYRLARMNRSFNDLNRGQLLATINESAGGLVILLEPGKWDLNGSGMPSGMPWNQSVRFQPLHGIEKLPREELAAEIKVVAVDADSNEPIESYTVTPGWQFAKPSKLAFQTFQKRRVTGPPMEPLQIASRSGPAFVQVEAEGYFPATRQVEGMFDQQVRVALEKGSGLGGTVLQPDEEPAAGCKLLMAVTGEKNSFGPRISISNRRWANFRFRLSVPRPRKLTSVRRTSPWNWCFETPAIVTFRTSIRRLLTSNRKTVTRIFRVITRRN
jgi:hypothetical protein